MPKRYAIEIAGVSHRYGQRLALADLSLAIEPGEIFCLLGPNGSGKSTLFRLVSTLVPLRAGAIRVFGHDVTTEAARVRQSIGVVFQSPSVDKKLTVEENIRYRGELYGLTGVALRERAGEMMRRLGIADRARDRVETLSGGLKRRVELAGGMLHQPRVLLLDEPSTGLDPAARSEMWSYLASLAREQGVTIVATTHLLEEAERADRIAILDEGKLVALDTPAALKGGVGGDTVTIVTADAADLARQIGERFELSAQVVDGAVRLELPDGHAWIARLVEAFPGRVRSITLSQPTLEDVFIRKTGRRFWGEREEAA